MVPNICVRLNLEAAGGHQQTCEYQIKTVLSSSAGQLLRGLEWSRRAQNRERYSLQSMQPEQIDKH